MNKITIIGAGNVGSTIAYTLSIMGLAKDIVMIDIKNDLALGEALDIRQGTPFCQPLLHLCRQLCRRSRFQHRHPDLRHGP